MSYCPDYMLDPPEYEGSYVSDCVRDAETTYDCKGCEWQGGCPKEHQMFLDGYEDEKIDRLTMEREGN